MQSFQPGWMIRVWLANLVPQCLIAGALHHWLITRKGQGDATKFDPRDQNRKNGSFTFNNQVLDNMFWTCASGVTIWSAYEVLMMWSLANGYAPMISGSMAWLWVIVLIFLIPVWETFYFFLIHRLLHWPPLYRKIHYLHHRNTNVGPWSGLSMHPIEHVIYLGSVLIHWAIPANPFILIYHLQYYTLSAATTHAGFEGVEIAGKNRLKLGTFHHQMHHRFFECNYGGLEIPWDKWIGAFHDGTPESHQQFLDKRKLKAQQAKG